VKRRSSVPTRQLITIAITIACLVGVIVMKRRCATAVDQMFRAMDQPGPRSADGGAANDAALDTPSRSRD
jgi:hypothetical protein